VKAVILAAGVASRLRPLTDATPKCLLPIADSTFLGRILASLPAAGVCEVVLVTGYLEEKIRGYVERHFPALKTVFITNPVYASTNNIYSFWLALEAVRGDQFFLLDGDILFDPGILPLLRRSVAPAALAVRTAGELGDEEIKVQIDDGRRVRLIGKHVPPARAFGESIGIEIFKPESWPGLYRAMENKVVREKALNVYYEHAFQDWIDAGADFEAVDIGALAAAEIDTVEDYERAGRDILPLLPRIRS
jgi:choline kinase